MTFLPVKGYEGFYEVSDQGQVRSLDRIVLGRDGTPYPFKGRVLRPHPNKNVEYLQISLWKDGIGTSHYVHILVAQAHIPNPNQLPEVNHRDGIRVHNFKSNLEWITSSGNKLHAVQTGLRIYTTKLTKDEMIACLFDVIAGESYGSLATRVPYGHVYLSIKLRKLAVELGIEHELDESLMEQRIIRARTNGAKNRGGYKLNRNRSVIKA